MMAFILATDFDFNACMRKMAFFWKPFSRQWRFCNMISFHEIGCAVDTCCSDVPHQYSFHLLSENITLVIF